MFVQNFNVIFNYNLKHTKMKDQIVIEQMQAQAQAHNLLVNVAEERTHLVDSIVQTNVRRHTTLVFYF